MKTMEHEGPNGFDQGNLTVEDGDMLPFSENGSAGDAMPDSYNGDDPERGNGKVVVRARTKRPGLSSGDNGDGGFAGDARQGPGRPRGRRPYDRNSQNYAGVAALAVGQNLTQAGPAGQNGAVGQNGPAGQNGAAGQNGPAGSNGPVGPVGQNGAAASSGQGGQNGA
ncbi:MAG: collagen-like protein, partial [Treponema sp.]|nr:collagen-like protein [Treponema sp.]